MSLIGNIVWIIFGGLVGAIGWCIAGIICCITIVGIPFGKQCFKLATLQLAPFGRSVVNGRGSTLGVVGNILWLIFLGWELCLINLISAAIFAITIVGIPFAIQSFKLAKLSLLPFGKDIQ